jgi:hypothetical protein
MCRCEEMHGLLRMPKPGEQEQAQCQTGQMLSPFLAIGCKRGLTETRVFFQINSKHIHTGEKTQCLREILLVGSVLPPAAGCRKGSAARANPCMANSRSLLSSAQRVFFLSATNLRTCQTPSALPIEPKPLRKTRPGEPLPPPVAPGKRGQK